MVAGGMTKTAVAAHFGVTQSMMYWVTHPEARAARLKGTPKGRRNYLPDILMMALVDDSDQCWEWLGPINPNGYGVVFHQRRPIQAHRYFYEQAFGEVPEGKVLHHACHNKLCMNPAHLVAVDRAVHPRIHRAQRTHCRRGHPATYYRELASGVRYCRACRREWRLERIAKGRAA